MLSLLSEKRDREQEQGTKKQGAEFAERSSLQEVQRVVGGHLGFSGLAVFGGPHRALP